MKNQEAKQIGPTNAGRGASRGSIVVVGSGSSFVATPSMVQYTTAKHAVMGLVKNAGKSHLQNSYVSHTFSQLTGFGCFRMQVSETVVGSWFRVSRLVLLYG